MKYNTIYELNERGRATICPQCKNEDIADDANYCEICGASLINRCTNTECNTIGSGKARFCKECGSETEFGKRGYLKPWNTEGEIEIIDEIVEDEIEINMDELEDNEEDEAPEIDHSILGDFGAVYSQDDDEENDENEETYDRFQEFSYKGGDEFFEIF